MFSSDFGPFINQELRARWRGWQSFAIAFGVSAVLAWVFWSMYGSAAFRNEYWLDEWNRRGISAGREVRDQLAWIGTMVWVVLPATLTASVIAHERERGTLEQLLLSPLSPWQIVLGKLGSALSFMAVIFFSTIPLLSFTLYLGGVSPAEVARVAVLHATSGLASASVGIAASAGSERSGSSRRLATAILLAWLGSSWLAEAFVPLALTTWWSRVLAAIAVSNPFTTSRLDAPGYVNPMQELGWLLTVGGELLLSWVCLFVATKFVRRPFVARQWVEAPPRRRQRDGFISLLPSLSSLSNNPIFQRELRSRFRMRRPGIWHGLAYLAFGMAILGTYCYFFYQVLADNTSKEVIYAFLLFALLAFAILGAAITGATGFAREKELGTWEAIRLSSLTPGEIIRGKMGAFLAASLIYASPLAPLLFCAIDYQASRGPHPQQLMESFLMLALTAGFYNLLGLRISWEFRRSNPAVTWSFCSVLALNILLPIIVVMGGAMESVLIIHPLAALSSINWESGLPDAYGRGQGFLIATLIASGALWSSLHYSLRHKVNDRS